MTDDPVEHRLSSVNVTVKLEYWREDDGRWAAEAVDLPGVLAYGSSRLEAGRAALALAFRALADQLDEHAAVGTLLEALTR